MTVVDEATAIALEAFLDGGRRWSKKLEPVITASVAGGTSTGLSALPLHSEIAVARSKRIAALGARSIGSKFQGSAWTVLRRAACSSVRTVRLDSNLWG